MRMQVDEARRDDQSSCVYLPCGGRARQAANRDDPIRADSHIPGEPGIARAVDDAAAANQEVIGRLPGADQGQAGRASDPQHEESCPERTRERASRKAESKCPDHLSVAIVAIFDYCCYFRL